MHLKLRGLTQNGYLVFTIALSVVSYRVIDWIEPHGLSTIESIGVDVGLIIAVAIPLYFVLAIWFSVPPAQAPSDRAVGRGNSDE
ncbi:hypothetical protein [Patulibacter medicamentivorans]|uniref:hypothetical protein n=1 Tax=Patulibacter medicamentivorans TaxID=1097667 RepID=UPI0011100A67|nr:hypothetical protein [Patulibacter medicamentivorans]